MIIMYMDSEELHEDACFFIGCEAGNVIFNKYKKNFQDTGTSYNYLLVSMCEVTWDEPQISFGWSVSSSPHSVG